jgi:hypothetical protein
MPESNKDATGAQFNRLIAELLSGNMRHVFRPWEIQILLDIDRCNVRTGLLHETLRQYRKAVQRQMEKGPGPPMLLSQYLESLLAKRKRSLRSRYC